MKIIEIARSFFLTWSVGAIGCSVGRKVRGVDVDHHPALHVGALAGEVPAAAHQRRPPHSRVLAPGRAPDVPTRGLEAASPGATGVRAKHPERGDDAQRQARGGQLARRNRRRQRYLKSVSILLIQQQLEMFPHERLH